jgi:hypothetical protein
MHEDVSTAQPRGDVRHSAEEMDPIVGKLLELASLRPLAEHDEMSVRDLADRTDRDVDSLLRLEAADSEHQRRILRNVIRRIRAPRSR